MKMTLAVGDERQEVRVLRTGDELRVTFADGRVLAATVERHGDGTFTLIRDGRRRTSAGTVLGTTRQLWTNGRTLRYAREGIATRAEQAVGDLAMASSIPAVVRELLVAPGDTVVAGQKLLLLESMKMVLPIVASRAGRVRAIVCAPGDSVPPGEPLVVLEDE